VDAGERVNLTRAATKLFRRMREERNSCDSKERLENSSGEWSELVGALKLHKDFLRFVARKLLDCGNPVAELLERSQ